MFKPRGLNSFNTNMDYKYDKNWIYLVAGINTIVCASSLYPELKYSDASVLSAQPYCDFWFHSESFDAFLDWVISAYILSTSIGFMR